MATIGQGELINARRELAKSALEVRWTKAQVNLALQAIEDWFEEPPSAKSDAAAAIETAVPGLFSNAEKKKIGGVWMLRKALRELL